MSSHLYYNSELSEMRSGFHQKTQITKNDTPNSVF